MDKKSRLDSSDAVALTASPCSPEAGEDDSTTSHARPSIPCVSSEVAYHMIVLLTGESRHCVTVDDALMAFDGSIRVEKEEIKTLEEIRNYYDTVIAKRKTA